MGLYFLCELADFLYFAGTNFCNCKNWFFWLGSIFDTVHSSLFFCATIDADRKLDGPLSWSLNASKTREHTKCPCRVGGKNRESLTASLCLVFKRNG